MSYAASVSELLLRGYVFDAFINTITCCSAFYAMFGLGRHMFDATRLKRDSISFARKYTKNLLYHNNADRFGSPYPCDYSSFRWRWVVGHIYFVLYWVVFAFVDINYTYNARAAMVYFYKYTLLANSVAASSFS